MNIAIDIGGTKTAIATIVKPGEIRDLVVNPSNDDFAHIISMVNSYQALHSPVNSITIGTRGDVDSSGAVSEPKLFGWNAVPVKSLLNKQFSCPVIVNNDTYVASVAAVLETNTNKDSSLYLSIGTGLGVVMPFPKPIYFTDMTDNSGQSYEHQISGKSFKLKTGLRGDQNDSTNDWIQYGKKMQEMLSAIYQQANFTDVLFGGGFSNNFQKIIEGFDQKLMLTNVSYHAVSDPDSAVLRGCSYIYGQE